MGEKGEGSGGEGGGKWGEGGGNWGWGTPLSTPSLQSLNLSESLVARRPPSPHPSSQDTRNRVSWSKFNFFRTYQIKEFTNSEDPDEMSHYAAYHQDLHYLIR